MNLPGRVRWRAFAVTLALTLATVVAFWVLVPPTYLTNDDVAIRRDIEGLTAPGAAPTGYVLMAHSLLAWSLVALQHVVHAHWWDVVVGVLFIGGVACALAVAWAAAGGPLDRVLAIAAVLVAIAPLLAGMQFTISSTIAAAAAAMLIYLELLLPAPRRSIVMAASLLLLLALLVRAMSASAASILPAAMLVPIALTDSARRATVLRRWLVAAVAIGGSALALVYLDEAVYRLSPAWAAYHQNNWMTGRLFEWGGDLPSSLIEPLRARIGWSENDWNMLGHAWGIDPQLHSEQRIENLYTAWSSLVDWRIRLAWLVDRTRDDVTFATVIRLLSDSYASMIAAALLVAARANVRGALAALAATVIFLAACMAMEIGFKELPFRLFAPLQVAFVLVIALISTLERRSPQRGVTAACVGAALALFAYGANAAIDSARADSRQSRETDAQVTELMNLHPSLVVMHSDSFPSEHWWRPFHTPPPSLAAIQVGLNNANPYVQRFLSARYPRSLLYAMCTDPSILVVAEEGRLEPVTLFLREHYHLRVAWEQVYSASFRVWRCSVQGAA